MSPIIIKYHPVLIRQQLNHLIWLDYLLTQRRYIKYITGLICATLIFVAFMLLTPGNAWVTVKAVFSWLFALCWLAALGWLVKLAAWWWRRVKWRNTSLARAIHAQQQIQMTYDAEGFRFLSNHFDTGLKWELFEYYTINKGSLYLFTIPALYESLHFAPQEVGEDHYQALVRLAEERLKRFADV